MLTDGQPPLRRTAARTGPVIDSIGLCARRRHDKHEALQFGIADKIGGVAWLFTIDNPLGDLFPHRAPHSRHVGTMSAPKIVGATVDVGFWRKKSKVLCGCWCEHSACDGSWRQELSDSDSASLGSNPSPPATPKNRMSPSVGWQGR